MTGKTAQEVNESLMKSILQIGTLTKSDDVDGARKEEALAALSLTGVPKTKDTLFALILGIGMGVIMKGDNEDARKEAAKPLLRKMMYLYYLIDVGEL